MSLSVRLRPDIEAAPWVIEEVKALEAKIERLQNKLVATATDLGLACADLDLRNAEIERLHEVIDRAAKAWMSLEPPVAWEGDVADAMAAGVAEIERLQEVQAENEILVHAGQELRRACEHKNKIIDNMQDTIERLREDAEAGNDWERQLLGCDKELTEAYAEIERLKKALSKCTTDIGSPWRHTGPARRFEEINRIVAEALLKDGGKKAKAALNTKPEPPPSRRIKEWRYK